MKTDIILCGVGGQGILSIANIIGYAAVENGLYLKQSEVHGMSQRGGAVESHLRISDKKIFSDLIPLGSADMLLSVEPMEALRYVPFLSENGWIVTNTKPFVNIPNYPDINTVYQEIKKFGKHILIDADNIAREVGSPKAMNMVILGASSRFLNLSGLEEAVKAVFGRKGVDVVKMNLEALEKGRLFAENYIK